MLIIPPPLHPRHGRRIVRAATITPPPPPPPASVLAAQALGFACSLRFDRAMALVGGAPMDGSILIDGLPPLGVGMSGSDGVVLTTVGEIFGGSTWQILAQPGYLLTPLLVPQSGVFDGPPPPPPPPATVIAASCGGFACSLRFDRPVALVEGAPIDGSIAFDGNAPLAVALEGEDLLTFTAASELSEGSTWAIDVQPGYVATAIAVPESGTFPTPPPPAVVNIVSVSGSAGSTDVVIEFDAPVTLAEGAVPDDAMLFGDLPATAVVQLGPQTLGVTIQVPVVPFSTPWGIYRQPGWIVTAVAWPMGDVIVGA